jgi:tetratricopeptide (TPR) repeat protein
MPPEQQAAFDAVQAGRMIHTPIDGRADVYALGLVLNKLLAGHAPAQPPSPGVQAILERCTRPNPAERYPTAGALATDFRRHLAALPLQGVRNRSVAERWSKWRRRRPHVLTGILTLVALTLAGIGLLVRSQRQVTQAEAALRDGHTHLHAAHYTEAANRFRQGEELLDWLPFQGRLRGQLREGRHATERAEVAAQLRHICERVRPLYGADLVVAHQVREAAQQCRVIWNERARLAALLDADTDAWRHDLLDLGILTAHLECRAARATPSAHRQALATLAEAETLLGPSRVLHLEQAVHARALGQVPAPTSTEAPRRAWEHLAIARQNYATGAWDAALRSCTTSLAIEPSFGGYYQRGLCQLALNRTAEAIADFSAASALAPTSAWCLYNRSQAYTNAGQLDAALTDCNRTLELDPQLAQAYLARATIHRRLQDLRRAHADLDSAQRAGLSRAPLDYERALVFLAARDRAEAMACVERCLAHDPQHQAAKSLRAKLQTEYPQP